MLLPNEAFADTTLKFEDIFFRNSVYILQLYILQIYLTLHKNVFFKKNEINII